MTMDGAEMQEIPFNRLRAVSRPADETRGSSVTPRAFRAGETSLPDYQSVEVTRTHYDAAGHLRVHPIKIWVFTRLGEVELELLVGVERARF